MYLTQRCIHTFPRAWRNIEPKITRRRPPLISYSLVGT